MSKEAIHTSQELKELQAFPLDIKINMSRRRIKAWYKHWDGNVHVSFSGGKDSTVLLHLARSIYPDVPAVFVDTGLEYPEIRQFVKKQKNVTILRPKINFRDVILKYGYPIPSKEIAAKISGYKKGQKSVLPYFNPEYKKNRGYVPDKWHFLLKAPFNVSSYCCNVMKKAPSKKYEKQTGNKPILGTLASESFRRKTTWMTNGCNAFDSKRPISTPLAFWTENDILTYIIENKIEIASVYGDIVDTNDQIEMFDDTVPEYKTTGCDRTGCMFCMFGIGNDKEPNRFQRMKVTHPKLYEYCMKPVDKGGLGIAEVLKYVNIPFE